MSRVLEKKQRLLHDGTATHYLSALGLMVLAFRDEMTEWEYSWSKSPPCSNEASDASH